MTRVVTTTYRYKPPPKRKGRKLAGITGPAIVTAKGSRRPGPLRGGQAAAEVREQSPTVPASVDHIPAIDDPKSAIVTGRKPGSWRSGVEHQQRGDAADALFREMKRRIAATVSRTPKKP